MMEGPVRQSGIHTLDYPINNTETGGIRNHIGYPGKIVSWKKILYRSRMVIFQELLHLHLPQLVPLDLSGDGLG
jgi:hypothetical protein